ncbi:MAG TPA: acetamidase/formamidase family protein, partial [Candidatus Eisenbacteria bacterium]|nr:acetamidase/formamidase family protein [Candidatus Eisenbacteria bacterium]
MSLARPARRELRASFQNVCVGYFDNRHPPAAWISSGDTISVETLNHFGDGVSRATVTDDIVEFRRRAKEFGPHTVTGPIFVEGAQPGDVSRSPSAKSACARTGTTSTCREKSFRASVLCRKKLPVGQLRHFELD